MEEIYKDLSSPQSKEFEKLLNNEFSKSQISEGKIADGTITKITNKLIFLELPVAKSEGTLDISEMKLLKEDENLSVYKVFILSKDKKKYYYIWQVEKVLFEGKLKDCWMTTVVSNPEYIGEVI